MVLGEVEDLLELDVRTEFISIVVSSKEIERIGIEGVCM